MHNSMLVDCGTLSAKEQYHEIKNHPSGGVLVSGNAVSIGFGKGTVMMFH